MADAPVASDGVVIEAALHELVSKSANPHVPYGPEEVAADAAACVEAGATLVHFHARDPKTGEQRWHDDALYTDAVARMRVLGVAHDVPWYPTYPGVRPEVAVHDSMPHLAVLAHNAARLELAAIDVGSGNLSPYHAASREFLAADGVKRLPHSLFHEFTEFCRAHELRPYLGVYEPGHIRHVAAYLDAGWLDAPLVLKCFFSEHHPYGLPPVARSVEMTAEILATVLAGVEYEWFVQCYGRAIWSLAPAALHTGGHVRVGLGDYHPWDWADDGVDQPTNAELTERAVKIVGDAGRPLASVAETRRRLGLPKTHTTEG
jgi:3-keto-5-aminohexanoate cleavage enzyme